MGSMHSAKASMTTSHQFCVHSLPSHPSVFALCVASSFDSMFSFDMSPLEVVKFCTDCVLSDGEEPCDIPEGALETGLDKLSP